MVSSLCQHQLVVTASDALASLQKLHLIDHKRTLAQRKWHSIIQPTERTWARSRYQPPSFIIAYEGDEKWNILCFISLKHNMHQ